MIEGDGEWDSHIRKGKYNSEDIVEVEGTFDMLVRRTQTCSDMRHRHLPICSVNWTLSAATGIHLWRRPWVVRYGTKLSIFVARTSRY